MRRWCRGSPPRRADGSQDAGVVRRRGRFHGSTGHRGPACRSPWSHPADVAAGVKTTRPTLRDDAPRCSVRAVHDLRSGIAGPGMRPPRGMVVPPRNYAGAPRRPDGPRWIPVGIHLRLGAARGGCLPGSGSPRPRTRFVGSGGEPGGAAGRWIRRSFLVLILSVWSSGAHRAWTEAVHREPDSGGAVAVLGRFRDRRPVQSAGKPGPGGEQGAIKHPSGAGTRAARSGNRQAKAGLNPGA